MTVCVVCAPHGVAETVDVAQGEIHHLLDGGVTFVGAIATHDTYVVARDGCVGPVNVWYARRPEWFHAEPRGPIVFFASDAEGREVDLSLAARAQLDGSKLQL